MSASASGARAIAAPSASSIVCSKRGGDGAPRTMLCGIPHLEAFAAIIRILAAAPNADGAGLGGRAIGQGKLARVLQRRPQPRRLSRNRTKDGIASNSIRARFVRQAPEGGRAVSASAISEQLQP